MRFAWSAWISTSSAEKQSYSEGNALGDDMPTVLNTQGAIDFIATVEGVSRKPQSTLTGFCRRRKSCFGPAARISAGRA